MTAEQTFREALAFIWSSCESIGAAKLIAAKALEWVDGTAPVMVPVEEIEAALRKAADAKK